MDLVAYIVGYVVICLGTLWLVSELSLRLQDRILRNTETKRLFLTWCWKEGKRREAEKRGGPRRPRGEGRPE